MMKPRKIFKIFDRDIIQWMTQLLRDVLVLEYPKRFGRGLEDQITYYSGRSGQWYRYEDDDAALRRFFCKKPLSAPVFQPEYHARFPLLLSRLRHAISVSPRSIRDDAAHLLLLTRTVKSLYPTYNLSNFIPGAWREEFLRVHGKKAQPLFEMFFHWREMSEGVLKLTSDFLYAWLSARARAKGYRGESIVALSVRELSAFAKTKKIDRKRIEERLRGYVHMNGRIALCTDFPAFLEKKGLYIESVDVEQREFKGTVACPGAVIRGTAATIFNSREVAPFPAGAILVTPMTQPEYVPAMKKAKAIVTDEGGLTCHAAIVSREMGIPCIIGTKIATRLIKDGDTIEVDAQQGVVRILK